MGYSKTAPLNAGVGPPISPGVSPECLEPRPADRLPALYIGLHRIMLFEPGGEFFSSIQYFLDCSGHHVTSYTSGGMASRERGFPALARPLEPQL